MIVCRKRGGEPQTLAVAYHALRTWAFDADPTSFLVRSGMARAKPSGVEYVIAASACAPFLVLGSLVSPAYLVGAALAPGAVFEGRKWFLRKAMKKQGRILLALIDLLALESIGLAQCADRRYRTNGPLFEAAPCDEGRERGLETY